MSTLRKMLCVCVMAAVLVMAFPVSSLAVDPVSAAVMANAAAQAIAAYGASQGVSMSFDVGNTDGIGEGVHDLWTQFKEDSQNSNLPTYDSFAVNIWTGLYSKIGDKIGINISSENVDIINQFWEWLLTGPAEMQKVDDQYYEFLNTNPITVNTIAGYTLGNITLTPLSGTLTIKDYQGNNVSFRSTRGDVYYYVFYNTSSSRYVLNFVSTDSTSTGTLFAKVQYPYQEVTLSSALKVVENGSEIGSLAVYQPSSFYNVQDGSTSQYNTASNTQIPSEYVSVNSTISIGSDSIAVKPYSSNLDVSFPLASPYTGTLDNLWDNSTFGDGTGTLTDAQSIAISNSLSQSLVQSGELTLDAAADINASEVYIPLLPVELPSFNFSLSGIWYYVVSWVESLGAWLTLMFQTWAVLPSAITLPVYATAVIVIVLGVYKRFFM